MGRNFNIVCWNTWQCDLLQLQCSGDLSQVTGPLCFGQIWSGATETVFTSPGKDSPAEYTYLFVLLAKECGAYEIM